MSAKYGSYIKVFIILILLIFRDCNAIAKESREKELELLEILIRIENENDILSLIEKRALPNEIGDIMIIMYHGITLEETDNDTERSIACFKSDLKALYDRGYRLIKIEDLVSNNICVEAGFSPVIITFDDGRKSAFSLAENDGKLTAAKECAVYILDEFHKANPDFGKGAVFYINGDEPFNGSGTAKERFEYLLSAGYEIGNHTYSHASLKNLDALSIQNEISSLHQFVNENAPGHEILTISYPYGQRPLDDNLKPYVLKGENYEYRLALREGLSGASAAPNNIAFDPLNIPRIRATDNEKYDLGWYLEYYDKNPHLRYISDGDPNIICVPKEIKDNIDCNNLNGKELILY